MKATFFFVVACLVAAAHAAPAVYERPINADCVPAGADGISLFPEQFMLVGDETRVGDTIEVTNAQGFSVQYFDTYKVVNNSIAGEIYVLYQCGADAPSPQDVPPSAKFFQIPLVSVSVPETIPYAALVSLGVSDRAFDAPSYVTAPCGQVLLGCDRAAPDFMALSNSTLLESTVGPVTDGLLVTGPNPFRTAFAFSSSQDPGLLNRAEWTKFLALFFNREREASQQFAEEATNYQTLKAEVSPELVQGSPRKVAFVSYFIYPGVGENYQISWADYKAELARDTGTEMLDFDAVKAIQGVQPDSFSPTSLVFGWEGEGAFPSRQAALEAFLGVLNEVDVVIDETFSATPSNYTLDTFLQSYNLTQEQAQQQPWFANGKVYREDGLLSQDQGMDWFEGALLQPASLLRDMIRAVRPEIAEDPSSFVWLRNLFTETPVVRGPGACQANTSCDSSPVPICPFVQPCPSEDPNFRAEPALLKGTDNGACIYEKCTFVGEGPEAPAPPSPGPDNAADLAAPAVVLMTLVVVLVEVLINC